MEREEQLAQELLSVVMDESMPTGYIFIGLGINNEGEQVWRVMADESTTLATVLGTLELAKLDMIARTDTGLPIQYDD